MTREKKRLEDSSRPCRTLQWLNRAALDFPAGMRAPAGYVLLAIVVVAYVLFVFNGHSTLTFDKLPDPDSWTRAVLLRDALEAGSWQQILGRDSSGYGTSLHWTRLVEILAPAVRSAAGTVCWARRRDSGGGNDVRPDPARLLDGSPLVGCKTLRRVEAGNVVRPGRRRHGAGAASLRRGRPFRSPPYHSSLRHGIRTCVPGRLRPRPPRKFGHLCGPLVWHRDRLLSRNVALCPPRFRGAGPRMGTRWGRGGCRPRGGMRAWLPSSWPRPGCSIRQMAGFSRSRWTGFRFPTSCSAAFSSPRRRRCAASACPAPATGSRRSSAPVSSLESFGSPPSRSLPGGSPPGTLAEVQRLIWGNNVEFHPLDTPLRLIAFGGGGILSLLFFSLELLKVRRDRRRFWLLSYATLCAATLLAISIIHIRFAPYASAAGAVALAIKVSHLRNRAGVLPAAVFGTILAVPPIYAAATDAGDARILSCHVAAAARWLKDERDVVLVDIDLAPELLWRTNAMTVATLYHRGYKGIVKYLRASRALTDDDARAALEAARVKRVLLCRTPVPPTSPTCPRPRWSDGRAASCPAGCTRIMRMMPPA